MSGFNEGSDNFKTSTLSDCDKSKMQVQAVNKDKYIESTKHGGQYRPTPVSLSILKNTPILKGFNQMQATETARMIKLIEVTYLIVLKGRPFSDYS